MSKRTWQPLLATLLLLASAQALAAIPFITPVLPSGGTATILEDT